MLMAGSATSTVNIAETQLMAPSTLLFNFGTYIFLNEALDTMLHFHNSVKNIIYLLS